MAIELPEIDAGKIIDWCVENMYQEGSVWLGTPPTWAVDVHDLFDFIAETVGVSKERIGLRVDETTIRIGKSS